MNSDSKTPDFWAGALKNIMEEIGIFDFQPQSEVQGTSRPFTSVVGAGDIDEDKDLYIKFKKLQRQLEFLQVVFLVLE